MDDLQILVKAIVDSGSSSSMDSELASIVEKLESKHKIELKVGLEDSSVQVVQTQLQAIARQVSSANRSGSTLQVFDTAQLQADGRKYFASTKTLVADVQKEFKSLGKVDVTNVFKNAKGDIQSFTASVTKADGTIEKFNFNLAQIKDGAKTLKGFVQISSSLTDRNMGSGLNKTLDYLNKIEERIKTIRSKTLTDTSKPLTADMQEYSKFNAELERVTKRIAEVRSQNTAMTSDQKREIDSLVNGLQRYGRELQKTAYAASDLAAKTFSNQKAQLQAALETDIKKWNLSGVFTGDFKKSVEDARATLNGAFDQSGLDAYKHKLELISQQFKQMKLDQSASGKILDADRLNTNIQSAQLRIQNLKQTYSALVNDPNLSARWQSLFDESQMVSSQKELTNLNAKIRLFEQELINAGKHTQSFWDNFKANAVKMGTWMILGGVISGVMRGVTGLYDAVVELDTAMVELKKVTNETDEAYDNFLTSAANKAIEIGTTYADFVSSTADFARLGYELEDAQGLAEVANIYAVVGDEVEGVDAATSSIISTMKAFNIEAKDAMLIVDKFNEVGNNFAISSGGIGDAMARSASAMAAANNTIDESIALIVAANNVIQDPDVVGNMWKTVSMRIRGAKTELEEAGLETEYMAESTASLRKQIKALTNIDGLGGFDIMEDDETFKSTYDIILGISKVWKEMSDIDQAALLELLAGKRQGNALASAINNMDDAVKVLETSVDAEGSALAEHAKWMDSIQAKQQQFQAQYQAFANTILNSELVKFAYDAGTGLLGWLTELVDTLGALPTLVGAITPFFDKLQLFQKSSNKNWLGTGSGISFAWNIGKENLAKDLALLDDYNAKIVGLGNSTSDLQAKQIIWNDTIGQGSQSLKSMVKISDSAAVSSSAYKNAMTGAAASTKGVGVASKVAAVGVGVLRTALNMLLNIGITLAISALVSWIGKLADAAHESKQEIIEAGDAAVEEANELHKLASAYLEMSYAVEAGTESEESLIGIQDELIAYLEEQGVKVRDLAGDYAGLRTAVIDYARTALQTEIAQSARSRDVQKNDARADLSMDWLDDVLDMESTYGNVSAALKDKGKEAFEYLIEQGIEGIELYSGSGELKLPTYELFQNGKTQDNIPFEKFLEDYRTLEKAMTLVGNEFGSENPVFIALADEYSKYDSALKDAIEQIDSTNEMIAQDALLAAQAMSDPDTVDEFKTFRENIIKGISESAYFDENGSYTAEELADSVLRQNSDYATLLAALKEQSNTVSEVANRKEDIIDAIIQTDEWKAVNGEDPLGVKILRQNLDKLSPEALEVAYDAVMKGAASWDAITEAIDRYNAEQEFLASNAGKLQTSLGNLWSSENFAETRAEIEAMAESVTGITAENVKELASESDDLAALLEIDGMNAQFLANVLQTMATGGDGLALITNEALALNDALDGMIESFDSVTAAKARYDAAMSVDEKDTNFKSYAEAFAELNAQFEAGTTNSNAFWAAAEFLFGSDQLTAWGWSDGLDEIYQAMENNRSVFEDAESAGAGFIDRLYEMSEAGELVNEQGEKLIEISKTADGGYEFNVDPDNIKAIADAMGLTEEATLACFEALSMWGDVNFYDIEEVATTLEEIGFAAETSGGKAVNVGLLTEQMIALGKTDKEIYDVLTALEACDGVTLLGATDNVETLTTKLQELNLATSDGVTITVDYESLGTLMSQIGFTKDEASNLITVLGNADGISLANASGEVQSVSDALAYIDTLTFANVTESVSSVSSAVSDVNESSTDAVCGELAAVGDAASNATTKVYNLQSAINSLRSKTITITYNVERKGGLLGVLGFAKGTKDAPAGEALVGEEGVELWQSGDKARLVGVNGPEIVNLNKGDKIYPNPMTKKMMSKSGKRLSGTIPAYAVGLNVRPYAVAMNDGGGGSSSSNKKTESTVASAVADAVSGAISGAVNAAKGAVSGSVNTGKNKTGSNSNKSNSNSSSNSSSSSSGKSFEDLYREHQHLVAMDKESQEDYLNWLNDAYQKAYKNNEIELEDYYKYQEEVYAGMQDLFRDYLGDNEHLIGMLEHYDNTESQIISIYRNMMSEIEKEIAAARAAGLDDSDEYIQELQGKWMDYFESIADIQEQATDAAKDAVDELVDFRIDMIKQELENEKDALNERLDHLKDFYDKQKEMLQDKYDQEKYLEEQAEKRKSVDDIQTELDQLKYDDSAWAQKRKLELEEELKSAQKDLTDFEKENALDQTMDLLDDLYEQQELLIQQEIDAIDEKLNDPAALYNQALNDIKNNTEELYEQMVEYNNKYGDGNPETVKEMWENAYVALKEYINLFGEAYKDIALANATDYKEPDDSWDTNPVSGTNPENQPKPEEKPKEEKKEEPAAPSLSKGSTITVKKSATHFSSKSGGVRMASFVPGGKYTVYQTSGNEVLIGRDGVYTGWIKKTDIVGYATGTRNATAGLHKINEKGSEYVFSDQGNNQYRLFSSGEKVLNASAANWLYDFANSRGGVLDNIVSKLTGVVRSIETRFAGEGKPTEIHMGDIIIQGNADEKTVSDIRKAQRETVNLVLKELNKLKR